MPAVKLALAAGLTLIALGLALTLTQAPATVAASTSVLSELEQPLAEVTHGATYCQNHETLPRQTSAIRIWLFAASGPRVSVRVSAAGRTLTSGQRGSGWVGGSVTIPVRALSRTVHGATLCVSFHVRYETIIVQGHSAPAALSVYAGQHTLPGRMWIEYLRPGSRSWLARIGEVAQRFGLGRAATGPWVAFLALALVAAIATFSYGLAVRELR